MEAQEDPPKINSCVTKLIINAPVPLNTNTLHTKMALHHIIARHRILLKKSIEMILYGFHPNVWEEFNDAEYIHFIVNYQV